MKVSGDDVVLPFARYEGLSIAAAKDAAFGRDDASFFAEVEIDLLLIGCETESFGELVWFGASLRQMEMISAP